MCDFDSLNPKKNLGEQNSEILEIPIHEMNGLTNYIKEKLIKKVDMNTKHKNGFVEISFNPILKAYYDFLMQDIIVDPSDVGGSRYLGIPPKLITNRC